MKKTLLILALMFSICCIVANAQSVTIDPKGNLTPILDIKSTTEGLVMPKMTVAQRNAITGLTAGTQVYCTNCTPFGPYSYDGGSWVAMFQTTTVSPITYTVGQMAQGGMVIWIDPASGGQHGLVVAMTDFATNSSGAPYNSYTTVLVGARSRGYYGGELNTRLAIIASNGNAEAAQRSTSVNDGGYGDWYLPAQGELDLIYSLRYTIGITSFIGASTYPVYSSSTETGSTTIYARNFSTGVQTFSENKTTPLLARAVRRF